MKRLSLLVICVLLVAVGACRGSEPERSSLPESDGAAGESGEAAPAAPATDFEPATTEGPDEASGAPLVVFLGDSLTAGLGLAEDQAYPALVRDRLTEEGLAVRVVNAGVSGDTTAGGLRRLGWVLRQRPEVVVVGLGANDGLRGLPVEESERNLREIVRRARAAGAEVVLLGMRIPPNYGPDYAEAFAAVYPRIARELDVALVPFLLEGVGGDPELNLPDGIHPNAEGHERVAENILPVLRRALR
jgi:acyl-CoA thioesterase-1